MKFMLSTAFSDPTTLLELAKVADEAGWDFMAISDHVAHPATIRSPYPYTEDGSLRWDEGTAWPDPWVTIAAMAGATRRIRFCTNIFVLPLRNPFAAAKAVGTAAVLSGNRVALGIGVGWMKEEFELLGQDFHTRGRRTDEMIEVMRKLWTGERVQHHGEFYDFDPVRMLPAPSERIPLYVGGLSKAAFRRVGRLADGWVSDIHTTEEFRDIVARLRTAREEHGRGREPLDVLGACSDAFDLDGYRRLEEIGVTHLQTMPWFLYGGDSPEQKLDAIRRFADDIIHKLR